MSRSIAVFGGSGRTGQSVVGAALRADYSVRGLVRRAGSLGRNETVSEVVGVTTRASDVERTLEACSAVCVVIGPHPPYTDVFCAAATEAILNGMAGHGIARIICQTGAMIGSYPENRTWPFELLAKLYQRRQPAPHADRVRQEELIRSSGLDWTLIKPPRLTNGPLSTRLRVSPTQRVGILSAVSRADLGRLIVDEVTDARFVKSAVFVRG